MGDPRLAQKILEERPSTSKAAFSTAQRLASPEERRAQRGYGNAKNLQSQNISAQDQSLNSCLEKEVNKPL